MKIAIYSPYLDTFGGGERYMMTIAVTLATDNEIDVLLDKHLENLGGNYLKDKLSKTFNLNLEKVRFITAPVGKASSFISRLFFFRDYDVLFYLTDGSIFYPTAKKNILHIQFPLIGQPTQSLWGKIKLDAWNMIIYNSEFTQKYAKENWPIKGEIIYPPVDVKKIKILEKKKYILSVGRFFGYLRDKKHGVLIKAFRELSKIEKIHGWSLHLVGSAGEGDRDYLRELEVLATGLPVTFYPNLTYDKLIRLYGESSIYWHAAGFKEEDPTKMEHFGISTVEAMAGGCVPVAIAKGGQLEIIESNKSGFLWISLEELIDYTLKLIGKELLRKQMAEQAIERAKNFSRENFEKEIVRIIKI